MNRLLVLRLSAMGDVIHTIPAVIALRDAHPEARVSWVVEAVYRELVETVAGVEAIPVRLKRWGKAPLKSRGDMRRARLAMRGSDVAVDFQGLLKSAALAGLSRAPRRIGFDRSAIREKPALLFTNERVAVDTSRHIIEQNLELAAAVSDGVRPPAESVLREAFRRFAADPEGKLASFAGAVVLLPGAGKPSKLWPVEKFRELAQALGGRALAVWGPGERERAAEIGAAMAPPTTLRELAWLLRHAALVIGGDTGPLHLAAALGTKVVGLYGPTDPRRTGPYGQIDHCVDHFHETKLMDSISVEQVMQMAGRIEVA